MLSLNTKLRSCISANFIFSRYAHIEAPGHFNCFLVSMQTASFFALQGCLYTSCTGHWGLISWCQEQLTSASCGLGHYSFLVKKLPDWLHPDSSCTGSCIRGLLLTVEFHLNNSDYLVCLFFGSDSPSDPILNSLQIAAHSQVLTPVNTSSTLVLVEAVFLWHTGTQSFCNCSSQI